MKTYNHVNCYENLKPSFIINLIDRDDGKKKKQGLEKTPSESVFKARMLKFAGWQIVVWDENDNCIEHPHWFEIAKKKWAKKYKDCSTPCSCALCRTEKYSRLHFKKETERILLESFE